MYLHFKTVADAVHIPCILYNVPGRTGCSISENVVRRLSVHPNIVGIKEASGSLSYAARIARCLSDEFLMYSGNDDIVLPMMALGSSGVISVAANILPREIHDMVWNYLRGDRVAAWRPSCAIWTSFTACSWRSIPSRSRRPSTSWAWRWAATAFL